MHSANISMLILIRDLNFRRQSINFYRAICYAECGRGTRLSSL